MRRRKLTLLLLLSVMLLEVASVAQNASSIDGPIDPVTKQKAEAGDAEAQNELGRILEENHDFAGAVRWYRLAANQGLSDAQINLGFCYDRGLGVEKNAELATHWMALAAAQGDPWGECNLGTAYLNGDGIQQDWHAAMKWFLRAFNDGTEAGDAGRAANGIGLIYEMRRHADETGDYTEAFRWYLKGAEIGYSVAKVNTCRVAVQGLGGITKNYQEGIKWCSDLAESKDEQNILGQYGMGRIYEGGFGVLQDFKVAADWYKRAAEHGEAEAQIRLAKLYFQGKGVERNVIESFMWAKIADSLHDPEAPSLIQTLNSEISAQELATGEKMASKWLAEHPHDAQKGSTLWKDGKVYRIDQVQ